MLQARRRFENVHDVVAALRPSYPVYCLRPDTLAANARRFLTRFPGTVLYAVKCNPHPRVLDTLYTAGFRHFDTASLAEIALICETYPDAHAYYMHPVKARASIRSAHSVYGVEHYVVDHPDELDKVLQETASRDLVIVARIRTPSGPDTVFDLSSKFGCDPAEAADLMKAAVSAGCKAGLAFHVGSQCGTPAAFRTALRLVGETVRLAGVTPHCVDVGGGFPAQYADVTVPPLEAYLEEIRVGLRELGLRPTVEIMAEPGRALVANACSLLTQVLLRKDDKLYINDGIYGSLSEMAQTSIRLPARLIRMTGEVSATTRPFRLNGPTCDSLDVVPGTFELPDDVREGDWVEIDQIGAYSNAMATRFNGFYPETLVEVHDRPPAELR